MSGLLYRVDPVVSVDEVKDYEKLDSERIAQKEGMVERAKQLSLNPSRDRNLEKAVEFQIRQDEAQMQALRNPWYSFIIKVAGFSNEPLTKFWKDAGSDKDRAQPLANTPSVSQMAQINAAVEQDNANDDKELGRYLQNRQYFIQSVEVRGYLFLTPTCYAHVCESVSLLERMCGFKINPDKLVQSEHSTYFARLVSLRIQMSRFLSGRYYSLSANYNRLRTQEAHLVKYFQRNLGTGSRGYAMSSGSDMFSRLESL